MGESTELHKLEFDGKRYDIDNDTMDRLRNVLERAPVYKVNGVSVGIIKLLQDALDADWGELIPDQKTRQMLAVANHVAYYDAREGASEFRGMDAEDFDDTEWITNGKIANVLHIIKEGNF